MPFQTQNFKGLTFGLLAICLWSTVAVAFKLGLRQAPPLTLLSIGSLTSLSILTLFLVGSGKLRELQSYSLKDWSHAVALSLFNPFLYYIFLFEAYDSLPTQIAQSLNFTWPIFLALGAVLVHREKVSAINIMSLIVSFSGLLTILLMQGEELSVQSLEFSGLVFGLLSALTWAIYWTINSKISKDPIQKLFTSFLFATPLVVLSDFHINGPISLSRDVILPGIYIGFFEMGITFILWLKALETTKNKSTLANLSYLSPIGSLFLIQSILGEKITLATFLGLLLILTGNLLPSLKETLSIHKKAT